MNFIKKLIYPIVLLIIIVLGIYGYNFYQRYLNENKVLKQVIERLQAESRIAEVLVTDVHFDEKSGRTFTTIKFLEYDSKGKPMLPEYFTFSGNVIQFQSLVIRFDDIKVKNKDKLKGKSAYIFWKVFMLDGANTQEFEITSANRIPQGYRIAATQSDYEKKLWQKFWEYALNPDKAQKVGIKNAQIEAPGTMFIPGTIYTIKIEHDGGMRIDAKPLPEILKGETIPKCN
jgi:hypothetical protein